jgi:hypothetical protein
VTVTFDTYFRISSYAMIASGTLALAVSGGIGAGLSALFALVLAAAWNLEETRWQLSERAGMFAVVLSLPFLYLDWKFQTSWMWPEETARAGIASLTHFTLFLSAVKLHQVKADRDWLFLYLISFFEVLLAAGLSVNPLFIVSLALYTFCALSTVVCFEIRRRDALSTCERHGSTRPYRVRVGLVGGRKKHLQASIAETRAVCRSLRSPC